MVVLAQLVRAPDCGSGGRRFEPGIPPKKALTKVRAFFIEFIKWFVEIIPFRYLLQSLQKYLHYLLS